MNLVANFRLPEKIEPTAYISFSSKGKFNYRKCDPHVKEIV